MERGGDLIIDDLKELADRSGPIISVSGVPTVNDDSDNNAGNGEFHQWSKWHNTAQDSYYVCLDSTPGSAIWKLIDFDGHTHHYSLPLE